MAEYQNIFTQVQVRAPAELGDRRSTRGNCRRGPASRAISYLARRASATPRSARSICGYLGIAVAGLRLHRLRDHRAQHVGLGELGPGPVRAPAALAGARAAAAANTACSILPPLNEGGWWLMAGFFLTASILLWWVRIYRRARALGMGTHVRLGLRLGDLALPRARLHPADPDGQLERGGALRHLPAPRLDRGLLASATATSSTTRSTCSRSSSSTARRCCSRCTARTILAVSRFGGEREIEQIVDRGTASERAALFWRWTMGFNATMESIHRWAWWFAVLTHAHRRHRHPAHRHRGRQLVPLGASSTASRRPIPRSTPRSSIPERRSLQPNGSSADENLLHRPRRLDRRLPHRRRCSAPPAGTGRPCVTSSSASAAPAWTRSSTRAGCRRGQGRQRRPRRPPTRRTTGGERRQRVYQNVQVLGELTTDEFNRLMASITEWVAPEQGCAYCHNTENMADDTLYRKRRPPDAADDPAHQHAPGRTTMSGTPA